MAVSGDPPLVGFWPGINRYYGCPNAPFPCSCTGACRRSPQEQRDYERFYRPLTEVFVQQPDGRFVNPARREAMRPEDV